MKIIYYSPHPTHDIVSEVGYATHQREVISALVNMGHEVVPVILGGTDAASLNQKTKQDYKPSFLKVLVKALLPKVMWTSFNNFKLRKHDKKAGERLEEAIVQNQPDLLYERSEYLQDSGARLAQKHRIKYFLEVNAPFVEEMNSFEGYSFYHKQAHRIEKFKLQCADKIFVVSSALGEFLTKRYQCSNEKIILQANCINPEKSSDSQKVEQLKQSLKPLNQKVIGFVGSIFPYHGVDMLIKGFEKSAKVHQNTLLIIVGDGSIVGQLKQLAKELSIADRVLFTGKIPHREIYNYIDIMDICVMAKSNWYGSPVKIFEYAFMKKPIIAPQTRPVEDVMEHALDGLIIEENEDTLEKAINYLLDNPAEANKMAEHFHQKVMQNYTWDKAALKIIQACT